MHMNNANHETCKYTQTAKHIKNIQLIEWTMTKDEQMKDAGDTNTQTGISDGNTKTNT